MSRFTHLQGKEKKNMFRKWTGNSENLLHFFQKVIQICKIEDKQILLIFRFMIVGIFQMYFSYKTAHSLTIQVINTLSAENSQYG